MPRRRPNLSYLTDVAVMWVLPELPGREGIKGGLRRSLRWSGPVLVAGGKFSFSHVGVVRAWCPRAWATRLRGQGKGTSLSACLCGFPPCRAPTVLSGTVFARRHCSSWPLADLTRCFPISSPHLLSPQFFLIFSKCFFTSVKLSCLHIYFDLWKCLSTIWIYHKHYFFRLLIQRGNPRKCGG